MRAFTPTSGVVPFSLALALLAGLPVTPVSQILENVSDSLTTYRYASNTTIQGVRPQVLQRGVTIDGAMRSRPAYPMALAGNPYENAWTGRENSGGIRIDLGAFAPQDVDIALPTDGIPWVIGRTYNARQLNSGGSAINSNGYQGKNWFQTSQPEIVFYDDATNTKDLIVLVYGADRYAEFARAGTSSNQFKGKNGAAGCFDYQSGSPDLYVYTDQNGNHWTFFGFNTTSHATDGQFWKVTTPNSKTSFVGDTTTASTAISNGFSSGKITTAYDASDRRFTYTYTTLDSVSRLTQVKAETKTGGTWASSPTGVATAMQVDYTYYTSESHGDIGDLKQVKITTRLNDSGGETDEQVKRKYYRYWEGSADDTASYDSSTNPGYPHALKYVYDFEGVRLYDWNLADDHSFDEDHLSASDGDLESYASAYFEYETGHKVRTAWFDGQCGCGGGSDGTFNFTYETNGSYTDNSGYDTAWAKRTVVERPDGSYLTQYFDEIGQGLSQVTTDIVPSSTSPTPAKWPTKVTRDSSGRVSDISTPENVTAYTHNFGGSPLGSFTTSTSAGLVRTFVRASSGDMTGFATDWKHKKGTSGTAYFDGSQTFTSLTKTITDVSVVRPLIATKVVYSEEISSGSSGARTTSYSYNDYSSDSLPLTIKTITQTNPTVATGNNGSNSATTVDRHYRKDGLVDFQKNEDATIDYTEYSNGQASKAIRDGDTTKTGANEDFENVSVPSSPISFASSGTPIHWKTTTSYTTQGFVSQVAPPGNTNVTYQSRLADHRVVVIQYADYAAGPNFYGPARFRVLNQAGKAEAEGVIAYTNNVTTSAQDNHVDETDSDPLLGINVGTVAQLRTSVYNETGHEVEQSRVYFSIPGSGAGTEGTHYDATRFAYDDSGQRIRTKEPSGTIRRSTYDLFGRVTASSIGTNDNGLPGGESSGSSNMVTTDTRTFDGGSAGKNGNLTTVARYYDSTNHDDTTFTYDYRGRGIVELPPLAPFTLHKPDNMGREIAVGRYSSSSGLDETDDPTSLATNRMALSQTFLDERGQTWKSQRHKIDDADGSDDDNLQTLNWYDSRGRLVKTDGPELRKTKYDRLGRVTDVYTLAVDNDSVYADADDVSGDAVLEERQTRYDATTGTVTLEVRIDRFHDDYGGGETTGLLDTNADGGTPDALKLTAADVKGRVQITAKWYDDLERLQNQVEYGTYGGSTFDRNGLSVPARSDTALRTTWAYNTDGTVDTITDPKALVTKRTYDAEGRVTKESKNYDSGVNSGDPYGSDSNVTVVYEYANDLRTKVKSDLPSGETDQVTIYIYGSTKDTPSQMKIATGHLLRATKYPDTSNGGTTVANIDSDASDVVSFAYDAQEREVYKKDQAGNIFETDYGSDGQSTQKRVTTLAGGFDPAIRRIATTYDSLGRTSEVVQYDNATVGSGTAKDGVKFTYDDWGQVLTYAEDRDSAVSGGGNEYTTTYAWTKATTGRNTLRKSTATIPSGRVLEYTYGTASGLHDGDVSRVTFVTVGVVSLARYFYNGVGQVVAQQSDEPEVMWNLYGSTGTYPDLDNFNRVVSSRWTKDLGTDRDFYSVALTYDRNSNITSATDLVHVGLDVKYTMDGVNRLTQAEEGTLSGGSITSRTRDEQWTLSQTGNWEFDKVDLNGDDDFVDVGELNDDRTHNVVNELTGRDTDDSGTDNYTLTYDAAGNMTDDGKDYEYEYDAFYRLRKLKKTSNQDLVAEYRYNGLGHRIAIHEDTEPDLDVDADDKWYYDAFDERWRHLARFRESDISPKEDFVPHQAGLDGYGYSTYVDLVVCRNRDANTAWTSASDGTLEERLYYCQNWKAGVSVIVTSAGTMKEWVKYSAYGIPIGIPGGDTDSDGDCDGTDVTQVQTWVTGSQYNVRGDINLDGVVDVPNDKTTINSSFNGITLGRESLTANGVANRISFAGYRLDRAIGSMYHVRRRGLSGELGRWIQRDPLYLVGFGGLAEYGLSSPVDATDSSGAIPELGRCSVAARSQEGCSFPLSERLLTIAGDTRYWRLYATFGFDINGTPLPGGEGSYNWNGTCGNSSCTYRLEFILLPQYKVGVDWYSTCSTATPVGVLHRDDFFSFWHGPGTACPPANPPTTTNPPTSGWPQWVGPHTSNHFGHSQIQIGTSHDQSGPFFTNPLECVSDPSLIGSQLATPLWRIIAYNGEWLNFRGLTCVCRCGPFPAPYAP